MSKNIIKIAILLISAIFYFFVINYYFSEKFMNLIKKNRLYTEQNIRKSIKELPILNNDTNDVIEFNTGINNVEQKIYKRNFWELFK